MAFCAPCATNVTSILADLNNSEGQFTSTKKVTNLLRSLTLCLKQTVSDIHSTRSFPSSEISSSRKSTLPTNEQGHLLIGKSCPLILKRYRIIDAVAQGTFSQIFRAVDLFNNRYVAVKVMRVAYDELGVRENALLQFMSRKTQRGKIYCKTLFMTSLSLYLCSIC